jgi:arsenate reductase
LRKKVLFFCACNSIRSQMAEGILRATLGETYDVSSAGLKPTKLSPIAERVMAEIGIDISGQSAKSIETFVGTKFDCVAMVCGDPKGTCPFLPKPHQEFTCAGCSGCCTMHPFFPAGTRLLHAQFQDLVELGGEEHVELYRKVRDELRSWVADTFGQEEPF